MRRARIHGRVVGLGLTVVLVASLAWAQTLATPATGKLTRLVVAVAPLGWDTNLTWLQSRSGMLDKRPALEYLVGIDRHTGGYMPELAEQWTMAPDGKSWTLRLRQGVPFHE
jgi:peptide/nickel transport system substrate-binding protein